MKISEYVADLTKRLEKEGVEDGMSQAQALICHHLKLDLTQFLIRQSDIIPLKTLQTLKPFETQLLAHKPITKIIGLREFWRDEFIISDDVLDPRADSEILIESILHFFPNKDAKLRLLDLGTGSGCLILSLLREYKNATAVAVDISDAALDIATKNAKKLDLVERVAFKKSNWFESLDVETFDIIISNPPYIRDADYLQLQKNVTEYDPKLALVGGVDGLDPYRIIAKQADRFLKENGVLVFEMGHDQVNELFEILEQNGYSSDGFDMSYLPNQASIGHQKNGLAYDFGNNPRMIISKLK